MLQPTRSTVRFSARNSGTRNKKGSRLAALAPLARTFSSILIVGALFFASGQVPALARTQEEELAIQTAKIRNGIARLGVGEEARVRIKLLDKSVLIGFVGRVKEDEFELVSPETELRRTIGYTEIEQLSGQNSETRTRVSVGENKNPFKNMVQLARRRIPGSRPGERTGNQFLSKPAVIVLVVLAVGLVLVGVELGKS